jgi:isopenicillin N synthase-like dioxygenase
MINALPRLFVPLEAKKEVALQNSPHFLGYSSAGSETTAEKADSREKFEFATELEAPAPGTEPLYEYLRGPLPSPPQNPSSRSSPTNTA